MKLSMSYLFVGCTLFLAGQARAESSFDEIQAALNANCGMCHNGVLQLGGLNVMDEEQVLASIDEILSAIGDGRMPVGRPNFQETEDGQLIIKGLEELKLPAE